VAESLLRRGHIYGFPRVQFPRKAPLRSKTVWCDASPIVDGKSPARIRGARLGSDGHRIARH